MTAIIDIWILDDSDPAVMEANRRHASLAWSKYADRLVACEYTLKVTGEKVFVDSPRGDLLYLPGGQRRRNTVAP